MKTGWLKPPTVHASLSKISAFFTHPSCLLDIPTMVFNLNMFVNNLDLGLFLTNPDSLSCKCNKSPFVDRYRKHIMTGDLGIIRNNVLRKLFIKRPKYREVRPINLKKSQGFHIRMS